jgi:hypothetical protein
MILKAILIICPCLKKSAILFFIECYIRLLQLLKSLLLLNCSFFLLEKNHFRLKKNNLTHTVIKLLVFCLPHCVNGDHTIVHVGRVYKCLFFLLILPSFFDVFVELMYHNSQTEIELCLFYDDD